MMQLHKCSEVLLSIVLFLLFYTENNISGHLCSYVHEVLVIISFDKYLKKIIDYPELASITGNDCSEYKG
jgi:hypothetical protein